MRTNEAKLLTGVYGTFRQEFPIDTNQAKTLTDEQFGNITYLCMGRRGESHVDQHNVSFAKHLPDNAREQYERLREHPFFDRFVLYKRGDDGMILAIGKDEFYYVLTTWDEDGTSAWVPQFTGDENRPQLLPACIGR